MKVIATLTAGLFLLCTASSAWAQAKPPAPAAPPAAPVPAAPVATAQPGAAVTPPADYVIGAGDVLIVTYWRDKDMSVDDAIVRPDGKITVPLIGDVDAIGLTPEQLKDRLMKISAKLLVDPNITVGVKGIASRKVHIVGGVMKPAAYDLFGPMDVVQLISVAGGLKEFVDGKKIMILRTEKGKQTSLRFNYKEVLEGKNLAQNIQLKPGDRVLVPE